MIKISKKSIFCKKNACFKAHTEKKKGLVILNLMAFMFIILSIGLISATDYDLKEYYDGTKQCVIAITDDATAPQMQTWTVGGAGSDGDFSITRISWYLDIGNTDINISIWDVTASDPVGTGTPNLPLYSETFSLGDLAEGWTNFTLSSPVDVVNGTQYAISINEVGSGGGVLCRDTTPSYSHGSRFNYKTPDTDDYNFRIYGQATTPAGDITINLQTPLNASAYSTTTINFTANYSVNNYDMENATYSIWYNNGTLFNKTTVLVKGSSTNQTVLNISNFVLNNYKWNVELCVENATDTVCQSATTNNSFTVGASVLSTSYNTEVFETSRQSFGAKFNILSGAEVSIAQLIYNGTIYPISQISTEGDILTINKTIDIPLNYNSTGNQTNNFNFRFTYAGSQVQNSQIYSQTSNVINLILCNSQYTLDALNFSIRDEDTLLSLNSTANPVTWESTFYYWLGEGETYKNYSYQILNTTNYNNFSFCIDPYLPSSYTFKTDANIKFSATDYSENEYNLRNSTLTNSTNNILLYLIPSALATKFYITVNQGIGFVTGAIVNVAKYFIGEGEYKTIAIKETDDSGQFPLYADLDEKYLFSVSKNGSVLGIVEKTLTCATAPCTEDIYLSDILNNPFAGFEDEYALNIYSNLTFNTTSRVVTYVFYDITGLANYFRLVVSELSYNTTTGATICDVYSYSSAGTLTCNLSGYNGDFKAMTYISRSPEKLDKVYSFFISDAVETLGLLGIILNIGIIITAVLCTAVASRGSPSAIVFILGLSILLLKIGGLFPLGWGIVAPIELILVWILMKAKV